MAKLSPNSLIHCAECGEDYSATYKRCPFCGAKNVPAPSPKPSRSPEAEPEAQPAPGGRREASASLDDTYVFDGQDLFDDKDGDDYASVPPKGGKRLAEKPSSNPFAGADINWPRMITFICSLVIIVAAMVIIFTMVYPQLRGGGKEDPTADGSKSPATAPVGDNTQPADPDVTDPDSDVTDPTADSTGPVDGPVTDAPPAGPGELTTISFQRTGDADFTLQPNESHTIVLSFDPADWSGAVTWTSTDTSVATVDANGTVTNVNATDRLRSVVITASAAGLSLESTVYCRGTSAASEPPVTEAPASDSPEPPATDAPASEPPATEPPATQAPSDPGTVTVGQRGTIVNATGGLNVRSGPGTAYERIGSLANGNAINVLEYAGDGWYKISFAGSSGTTEGYIMGDYISN